MLPLLTAAQIRDADAYTITHEPITSIDLMERACKAFVDEFIQHFPDKKQSISVYCGTGNNGGDGLAIARIFQGNGYKTINVKIARFSDKATNDFNLNLKRLKEIKVPLSEIKSGESQIKETGDIIIDALLGSGLNKPLAGDFKRLAEQINGLDKTVIAVDVPTGFFADGEIPKDATV
jgi:hydroxyethylthiazole kinase-like uncharacterized protein yjeF